MPARTVLSGLAPALCYAEFTHRPSGIAMINAFPPAVSRRCSGFGIRRGGQGTIPGERGVAHAGTAASRAARQIVMLIGCVRFIADTEPC